KVTKEDLLVFIGELLRGDPADKAHRRKIIDNLVYRVYIYNSHRVVYLNLSGGKGIEGGRVTLDATNGAVSGAVGVQTQFPPARQTACAPNARARTRGAPPKTPHPNALRAPQTTKPNAPRVPPNNQPERAPRSPKQPPERAARPHPKKNQGYISEDR
ncbi:MAG: hypothetical protein LBL66_06800, partial [Clostridiales bacterium]|nr:hypothetical protein [Clostridiales bacterium]